MSTAEPSLAFATHKGKVREKNEDAYVCLTPEQTDGFGHLLVVADGMGGAQAGELASYMLVNEFNTQYGRLRRAGASARTAIADIVTRANDAMVDLCEARPELRGMGTTCAVVAIEDGRAIVAHVGDSRVYQATPSGLRRVTRDHSRVQRMVDAGLLTPEQAESHPEANVITRALGKAGIEVDFGDGGELAVQDGPILLCSDGLHGPVKERAIELAMRHLQAQNAVEALIDVTLQCGAPDNVTMILYQPRPPGNLYTRTQWYQAAANVLERTIEWQGVLLKPVVPGRPGDSASLPVGRRTNSTPGDTANGYNDKSNANSTRQFWMVGVLACALAVGIAAGLYLWNDRLIVADGPKEISNFGTNTDNSSDTNAEAPGGGSGDDTTDTADSDAASPTPAHQSTQMPAPPRQPPRQPSPPASDHTNSPPPEVPAAPPNGSASTPASADASGNAAPDEPQSADIASQEAQLEAPPTPTSTTETDADNESETSEPDVGGTPSPTAEPTAGEGPDPPERSE